MPAGVEVTRWRPEHRAAFAALNLAWIEALFEVEPGDREVLDDPQGAIVDRGGEVFFALDRGRVIGTAAMLVHECGPAPVFELAKMAVAEEARGRGAAKALMRACLDFARERGAREVVLVSNSKLEAALGLYRSFGFEVTRLGPDPRWCRCDVAMRLRLDA